VTDLENGLVPDIDKIRTQMDKISKYTIPGYGAVKQIIDTYLNYNGK
jgi:hypothetical protein